MLVLIIKVAAVEAAPLLAVCLPQPFAAAPTASIDPPTVFRPPSLSVATLVLLAVVPSFSKYQQCFSNCLKMERFISTP